jgi:hypothetical protein
MNKCEICGYYEDLIAWHYEECPKLKEKPKKLTNNIWLMEEEWNYE